MKVFIIDNVNSQYHHMFHGRGWEIVNKLKEADLIQFTGGEDVTPSLYGHAKHKKTVNNPQRDFKEKMIFHLGIYHNIPMAGICRGGQFLNVMCGGKLWQHVENHTSGQHKVRDLIENFEFMATSTHHQMMIPHDEGLIVAIANQAKFKEKAYDDGKHIFTSRYSIEDDSEIVYYMDQQCLCFQPHPEFPGAKDLAEIYFYYLNSYLFDGLRD